MHLVTTGNCQTLFSLQGINSLFIICIGIITNNSLAGRCTRVKVWTSATEHVMHYCTWRQSALTTGPHGQVEKRCRSNCNQQYNKVIFTWVRLCFGSMCFNHSSHIYKVCRIYIHEMRDNNVIIILTQNKFYQCQLVSWSLTSPFSTNVAISEIKGQGWRAIPTQWRKASDILTSTLAAFCSAATQNGKGSRNSFKSSC